jgi:hypothetical protein
MRFGMNPAFFALAIAMALSVIGQPAWAGQAATKEQGDFSEVVFRLEVAEGAFLPLEPVPVRLELHNKTLRPIGVPSHMQPGSETCKVMVAAAGGAFVEFPTVDWGRWDSGPGTRILQPGKSTSLCGVFYYGREPGKEQGRYLFPQAGAYRLRVILAGPGAATKIQSNVAEVQVQEPKGSDAEAFTLLKSSQRPATLLPSNAEMPLDILRRTPDAAAALGDLEAFAKKFPESRYVKTACYFLGNAYLNSGAEEDHKTGLDYLERAVGKDGCSLVDQDLSRYLHLFAAAGRLQPAQLLLGKFLSQSTDVGERVRAVDEVMRAVRKVRGTCRVQVMIKADEALLRQWKAAPAVAVTLDWKEAAFFPGSGVDLLKPRQWNAALVVYEVPKGFYRVSIVADHPRIPEYANMPSPSVLVLPEFEVKGDMELVVPVTSEHLAELERKMKAGK